MHFGAIVFTEYQKNMIIRDKIPKEQLELCHIMQSSSSIKAYLHQI